MVKFEYIVNKTFLERRRQITIPREFGILRLGEDKRRF